MKSLLKFAVLLTAGFIISLPSARAQFSPGPLTQGHAKLEGINNCTQCHDVGEKINGQKCLACHLELKARIDAGRGFHSVSRVRTQECVACHFDHKGTDYIPIRWEASKENFDHDATGYVLEGKHKTDRCESCHRTERIKDPRVIQQAGISVSLNKTLLGLAQDCRTCHFDEHRDQFADNRCTECHDFKNWKKSSEAKFDHSHSNYPLTGLHVSVACIRCHALTPDPGKKLDGTMDADYVRYKNLDSKNCTPCHADIHNNKFGQDCRSCHTTTGWHIMANQKFDHTKTNYPLVGKHLAVPCEKCHQPDLKKAPIYKGMKFAVCSDCHTDAHAGQFAHRTDKGLCESCHDLSGYVPSLFTVERHNAESRYKLTGGHVKAKCQACHVKVTPREFRERTGFRAAGDSAAMVFIFSDQKCGFCHKDIHRGQFAAKVERSGCEVCHRTETWKDLAFDHNKDSEFGLLGKHKEQKCERCHKTIDENTEFKRVLYRPLSKFCEACHNDIHEGQFKKFAEINEAHPKTSCGDCHGNDAFKIAAFDHAKSAFPLTGAHRKVDCAKCHIKTVLTADTLNVLYKPISGECASCHPDQHEGEFEVK